MPWLNKNDILFQSNNMPKENTALKHLKQNNLTKDMVLIDDYNRNLNSWINAGGTGVKYLNGENSDSGHEDLIKIRRQ